MKIVISWKIVDTVILVLLAVNLFYTFQLEQKITSIYNVVFGGQQNQQNQNQQNQVNWQKNDCGKSLNGYEVVFAYMPTCPYCARMKPLVESSSAKFYWLDITNCPSMNFSEIKFTGYVPHFYCVKTGSFRVGAMSEDVFKSWVENCTSGVV
ncbi:MAG: hypothetical protein QXG39_00185 [Candidatus Aenigmatarchaeota archaeon]